MITLLDSKIGWRSQIGRGSVFEFCLPLNDTNATQQTVIGTHQEEVPDCSYAQGKRFVIVEDDRLIAQALTQSLEGLGAEVECFHIAQDALDQSNDADCYIVDYMLSGELNGIRFLNLLHQKLGKPINAVLMTGDTSAILMREAADIDWPVLHKPVNTLKLVSTLAAERNRHI